jgi:transcriptional regulator with XRE-family HTH domain
MAETESPPDRLRRMISELKEFMGMTGEQVAEELGWAPATLSTFMSGSQRDVRYTTGRNIEVLYEKHAEAIKSAKLAKAAALIASANDEA